MFGRMMNNYYYGKSGKGDFRKDDMPETRMQLFWQTLRTRLSSLCRLNLLYMLIWLPAIIALLIFVSGWWDQAQKETVVLAYDYSEYCAALQKNNMEVTISEEDYNMQRAILMEQQLILTAPNYESYLEQTAAEGEGILTEEGFLAFREYTAKKQQRDLYIRLLILFVCIAVTGPFTAGMCYVTRNWARDEHAFIWSDFRDAVKANWKIPLVLSTVTGILPALAYAGWTTYGDMAAANKLMLVPMMLVMIVILIWALCITYMHPLTVTYDLKLRSVIRNGLLLGIARLPFSAGIRLLHCVPVLIGAAAVWFFGLDPMLALVLLCGYYMIIGFGLSRFVTASYTNAVFDRYINPQIEGAKVNQGLREKDDEDDEEDGEYSEEETEETKE